MEEREACSETPVGEIWKRLQQAQVSTAEVVLNAWPKGHSPSEILSLLT